MNNAPASKKIILLELDIGQQQSVWFNYSAFTWYVDFDAVYDLIDPAFLGGVSAQDIQNVGSVASDAIILREAASVAQVQGEASTFYWDAGARRVYIHLDNHDEPALHRMVFGVVFVFANHAGQYGNMMYEGRLKTAPALSQQRDPLFWGRLEFGGGSVQLDNADGELDLIAEDLDMFGNSGRVFLGFDDEPRSSFRRLGTFTIGKIGVGPDLVTVELADIRRYLSKRTPDHQFSADDYPNMDPNDEGKAIPIGYGVLRNIPCFCTNEKESPDPNYFSFKLVDTTYHAIKAIDAVRVKGVTKTPVATDLNAGTFTLATADYDPGDEVTADIQGYEDGSGNLIANALDIISDILTCWLGIPYSSTSYEQEAWAAARLLAPDACYYADEPTEISEIIEDLAASVPGLFLTDTQGRFSFRIPNDEAYPVETFESSALLEVPKISYSPAETIGVARVGYSPDWSENKRKYLRDENMAASVLERYKTVWERTFETVLTTEVDAQAFAGAVLLVASSVRRLFDLRRKIGSVQRRIGDNIRGALQRRDEKSYLGEVKAQVVGISYDLIAAEETLSCRLIKRIGETVYMEADFYGDDFYGDFFYGASGEVAA